MSDEDILSSLIKLKSQYESRKQNTSKNTLKIKLDIIIQAINSAMDKIQLEIDENETDHLLGVIENTDIEITSCRYNVSKKFLELSIS